MELAYDYSDSTVGIAIMVLSYSLLTLLGMVLFGKHVWLRNGEVFSIYFNVLARFAPTEVRVSDPQICKECEDGLTCHLETDGCVNCNECVERSEGRFQFNIRPWAVGLARGESISPSTLIFVLFMLSSVTFDGFQKTAVWHGPVRDIQQQLGVDTESVRGRGRHFFLGIFFLGIFFFGHFFFLGFFFGGPFFFLGRL